MASCFVRVHMVVDLPSQIELNKGDHSMLLKEGCGEIWCCQVQDSQTRLEEAMTEAPALDACQLIRGTNTGMWLTILPSAVNGTVMGD